MKLKRSLSGRFSSVKLWCSKRCICAVLKKISAEKESCFHHLRQRRLSSQLGEKHAAEFIGSKVSTAMGWMTCVLPRWSVCQLCEGRLFRRWARISGRGFSIYESAKGQTMSHLMWAACLLSTASTWDHQDICRLIWSIHVAPLVTEGLHLLLLSVLLNFIVDMIIGIRISKVQTEIGSIQLHSCIDDSSVARSIWIMIIHIIQQLCTLHYGIIQ